MTNEDFHQLMNVMKDWIPKDASVAFAIGDCYLHYISGVHDIRLKTGQSIERGSVAEKVFQKQCKVEGLMSGNISRIPYYGIGYPINMEDDIGALVIILPPSYPLMIKQPFTFLTGKLDDTWSPIPVDQIAYIESLEKKTWFYVEEKNFQTIYTLKELDSQLPDSFLRIHRSYIVNISYIDKIARSFTSTIELTLKNGTVLPVSQTYSTQVRKKLGF